MQPLPRRELCHRIQVGSPRRPPRGAPDGALPPVEVQGLAALAVVVAFTPLLPVGYFPESLNHASGTVGRLCVAAGVCVPWCCLHRLGHWRTSLSPRPCHSHDHWVEKLPHPTRKYVVVAVGNGGNGADGEDLRPLLLQSAVGEALALARSHPRR